MNFRWSNICVLQFLLVLQANALKLVPAERTIVKTNGSTRTISKYYLLPQDDDDPYDPAGSAPSSDNEDFAQFLREFRAKKAAEQNPKKKVDKYKIYIKRKLKHKVPDKPKDGSNTSGTTTTEDYNIPIKITEHFKLPVTTTESNKYRITSEPSKLPAPTTEDKQPTEATVSPVITERPVDTFITETTYNPVTKPLQYDDITTTEPPLAVYTTIITTIHHHDKPSTTTEAHYEQTPPNHLTPEYDEENDDRPKDLLQMPHVPIFDSNEAQRGNQSEGPKPEKVIKHVETDGFVGDLTKIVSDEDPDVNKTATDTDEPKINNTLNYGDTHGIQPFYGDSKENKTKIDEEFQKLLELLKEPTKHIPGYDSQNWKPYNAQTPIHSDGIVFLDDSLKTPALKIPGQSNQFIDTHETTTVLNLLEPNLGANDALKLHPLWSLLVTDEQNSSHQNQVNIQNSTFVHEHNNIFDAQLHSAEILKNITSSLSSSGYTQLPNVDYLEAPLDTEYNQSATTTPKYIDNTQSEIPQTGASTVFSDYTKSGNIDFGQNETNSASADNTQSQNRSYPFYTDYTQFANTDLSQVGSNSDFTGYAESANNGYLHSGTDAVNIEHSQLENVNQITKLRPLYGDTHSSIMDQPQVESNLEYTGNTQSVGVFNDSLQTASNSQYADYTQSANTGLLNYAPMQLANSHYFQNQPHPQHAEYTQTSNTDVSQTGSNSAFTDYSQTANFELSQIESNLALTDLTQSANTDLSQSQTNSNYADEQTANTDYAQTGSNVDYTGYMQSENTNYSLTGTSSTFIDYTQAATTSFSESHKYPIYSDYTQSGTKDLSQTGANSAYSDYAYKETQSNPYYAYYVETADTNSHNRRPYHFGHRQILQKPNYQTSRKLFKGKQANKMRDSSHKNKWIEYQEHSEYYNPQNNKSPALLTAKSAINPSLAQINNYIKLARICPVCFRIKYKELAEQLDPNDEAMVQLFQKILWYSYVQEQSQQRHSNHPTQLGQFQKHLNVLNSQSQNQQQQPSLPSDLTQNDPEVIHLQFQQDTPILPKGNPAIIELKNQYAQKNIHNPYVVHVGTPETIFEKDETESISKADIPKIQLFNEGNLRNLLSAIINHRKSRRDKYSLRLYSILKLLLDVSKVYTSNVDDASWFGQLPSNTRNRLLKYLHHLVQQPWLQDLLLQLYKSNNNLDILRNPLWRRQLTTWRFPKGLLNINGGFDTFDTNYDDLDDDYQEVTVNNQDDESTILAMLKSYIHSPEFYSSVGNAEYYQKQNNVLRQIAMYMKQRGYDINFIEIIINKLHGALNRHIRKTRSSGKLN